MVASTMPGTAKMILISCAASQGPSAPCKPKSSTIDQSRDHRGHGEGKIDQGDQDLLAPKLEFGNGPCGRNAEDDIQREGNGRRQKRELDGGDRIRFLERGQIGAEAMLERFEQDGRERHEQK